MDILKEKMGMYGQYIRSMERQLVSEKVALLWLSREGLKRETERELRAAQDLALETKYHATNVLQTAADSKCRL